MPNFDGTGPMGKGPGAGKKRGRCQGGMKGNRVGGNRTPVNTDKNSK